MTHQRPAAQESHDYYKLYIGQVPGDDFMSVLNNLNTSTTQLLENLPTEKWDYRYAEGKWSIREVLLHIIDTERIMAHRALRIARNDMTPMPGFDQDDYIPYCDADARSIPSLLQEYRAVRAATLAQFDYFNDEMLARIGTASERPFSPRALGFIIAGHELHHLNVLHERYL